MYFIFLFSFLCTFFIFLSGYAQNVSVCYTGDQLIRTIKQHHYEPRPVDDEYSSMAFHSFLDQLDPERMIFSKEEVGRVKEFEYKIDDAIKDQDCSFFNKLVRSYKHRLRQTDSIIHGLSAKEITFDKNDILNITTEQPFLVQKELNKLWEQRIKYQIISSYLFNTDSSAQSADDFLNKVDKLKEQAIIRESCIIKAKMDHEGGLEQYMAEKYLKSLAFAFDPHSTYFPAVEKSEFEAGLSKKNASFGIGIQKNEWGEIVISHLVPGSPAWNSNVLNSGDVILSIRNTHKNIDFNCISLQEAMKYLNSPELLWAEFRLRKSNGKEFSLALQKEVIDVEENVIKSFILKDDKKVGYIYLPSFYSQMDSMMYLPNGCANDVAKELIKLKREGIEGLILDLRNNGGGSMLEAIRLAGIFINYGAVGIIDNKGNDPYTLKDPSRGMIYSDPLVILINNYSASASEFLAAALQDYNRAVIAGTSSFGKATSQIIVPVDAYKYNNLQKTGAGNSPGFLKLTTGKFYRVTGNSHQKNGVQPDIQIPEMFEYIDTGEDLFKSALSSSAIDKKTYYRPLKKLPVNELKQRSEGRILNNAAFQRLLKNNNESGKGNIIYKIPLEFSAFRSFVDSWNDEEEEDTVKMENSTITVNNPSYFAGLSAASNPGSEVNSNTMKIIRNDIMIKEAYYITKDLIDLTIK